MIQFDFVKMLWPLWVLIGVLVVTRVVIEVVIPDLFHSWQNRRKFRAGEKWRSDRELLQWLRGMKPAEFEDYIADLFSRLGYKTQATGKSHDGGIDVIAEKDGKTSYIQCKKFITQEVTVGAVRDFYGALVDHVGNGKGYFITTNKFTLEAEKFAEDKPIELVDGFDLVRYIRMTNKDTETLKTIQTTPTKCPEDGGTLVERTGKFGKFLGCSNYPKCRYTAAIK